MATIENRGDLQWRALIRRKGYPAQSQTFTTRAGAEAWARKIEREMETGKWRDSTEADSTTIGEALDRYIREIAIRKKGKGPANNKSQANVIKQHPIAKISMSRLRTGDVAAYREKRLAEVSANTVRLDMALLSHLFTVAVAEWGMESIGNPIKLSKKPNINGTARSRRLLVGEENRLLQACKADDWWLTPVVQLAIETGMRRSEIAYLESQYVDTRRCVLHLPETKIGDARDVPLSSIAVKVLESIPRRLDGKVFGIRAEAITTKFTKACAEAVDAQGKKQPIQNLRFHDLRHEATSRFFEKGLNPMQVASITGHKTLQTLKRYTHLKAEDLAKMLG
ncbi:MAG TPA: site-specific integrase [Mariprofundaceae bacterium]|nr:site-specific integrase [Mariprofundaceae bacterium]